MTGRTPRAAALVAALVSGSVWCAEPRKPAQEPKISSVSPLTVTTGRETRLTIRGTALKDASALLFAEPGVEARILAAAETEISVSFSSAPGSAASSRTFRVVTPLGVSNESALRVSTIPSIQESDAVPALPVVVNGTLTKRGETDSFWIEANAGDLLAIEAVSGFTAFDPAVSIWAPASSWFDPDRLERVAFLDEPLYFPGLDTNARLVHRFEKSGRHAIRVSAFQGQGGPDYVYSLHLGRSPATAPDLHPVGKPQWPERWFTRRIGAEWLAALAERGNEKPLKPIEGYRAVVEESVNVPVIDETGLIEGRIGQADQAHEIRLKIAAPRDLVIEVETPEATLPRFNPVVRIMQPDGHEVVTNVYTKLNNNGLYMMKMIQAKTTVTLRSVGEYRIQIRDITSDCWSKDFAYRVLIRPQVPHIGHVELAEDRVNLEPGQSKSITVNVDREEGFKGFVAVSAEGLPPGVSAVTGLENPIERPPLPNAGRRDRYYPIPQTATLMLVAAPSAPPTPLPAAVKITVRAIVEGKIGKSVFEKAVPLMVIRPPDRLQ